MRKTLPLLLLAALPALFLACKTSKEELTPEVPADYVRLQSGKYIIYRVDSTVYTNSGRSMEVRSYQERHLVDTVVTDLLGRPAWRIFRSTRNVAGTSGWLPSGTYLLTLSNGTLEMLEDNLRSQRLITPVREGITWKGNRFFSDDPYSQLYNFNNDDNANVWDYTIASTNGTVTYNGRTYTNVATVNIVDEKILPDTLDVQDNKVTIPQASTLVWIRGTATAPVTIVPPANPARGRELTVYNFSNKSAVLNAIATPPTYGRNYEYSNNAWTYGNGQDTLTPFLPVGFRTYARDQYARGIGLIAQEYILYEFQPNPNGTPYTVGFGLKRTILEHN